MKKIKKIASELPVMKACCKTCPFKEDKNGKQRDVALANKVTQRTLFNSHQICHGTEGKNREWNNRCKGSFDTNMIIYTRLEFNHLIK